MILRRAIEECGLSRYEIAKRSGVTQATLSRFMANGGIKLDSVDKLLDVLDLEVRPKSKTKGK